MYDLIIIWGWASGLFCSINASKNSKKLIIEKQANLWSKILLSGWGRCNFTNLNIEADRYFWQNKKMLASIFYKYSNYDFMNYLDIHWIQYNIEDNGRVILKSWKAKELLDFLIQESQNNDTEIQTWITITNIEKVDEYFKITSDEAEFLCKNLVIATWGISYPQLWTTGFGIQIAKDFGLNIIPSFPSLCWLETDTDFSPLSWSSITWEIEILDWNKTIYGTEWNILFTHRWLSGPAIFNSSAWLAEYMTASLRKGGGEWNEPVGWSNWISLITLQKGDFMIRITPNEITKKLKEFLESEHPGCETIITKFTNFRPLEEAKVSSGGVDMSEIKPNFECKNIPHLYFIWETLDIIGETWWFNLQWAWSSGFVCGQNF